MENADLDARENLARIGGDLRELATDYWGPDKANGRRSEIFDLLHRTKELEDRYKHYIDAEREETCVGIRALQDHLDEHKKWFEEESKVQVAKVNMNGIILAAAIPSTISALVTILVALFVRR